MIIEENDNPTGVIYSREELYLLYKQFKRFDDHIDYRKK
jgi:hypothetical protein